LLFVPLTTLAIGSLRGQEIGQGTGLNNMMRQLGGSFGIAGITTLIHVRQSFHRNNLINYISPNNPYYADRFNAYVQHFEDKGQSAYEATRMAYGAFENIVNQQILLLTYNDAYWIVGLIMLCAIPLLFLAPFKKGQKAVTGGH